MTLLAVTLLIIRQCFIDAAWRARRSEGGDAMTRAAFAVSWVLVLLFLALPIVIVALLSFSSASYLTFPPPAPGLALVPRLSGQSRVAQSRRGSVLASRPVSSCSPRPWARPPR